MAAALADQEARDLIRSALDDNLVVEAAAGTGKTTELVHRIVAVLRGGRGAIENVVAVTFTEKAAGELKLRLRLELERARQAATAASAERARLDRALARLEEARVSTIHGFCADLLRERPVEARVDPQFRVLTEPEARQMFAAVFSRWLEAKLAAPPEGVRRALRRASLAREAPSGRLGAAAWELAEWRDFRAPWRRDPFAREAEIDALVERLEAFVDLRGRCRKPSSNRFYERTEAAARLLEQIRGWEVVRGRDYDGIEGALVALATGREYRDFREPPTWGPEQYGEGVTRDDVLAAHAELLAALAAFTRLADADLAPLLRQELAEVVDLYDAEKRRSGGVDFLDLLLRARDLVRDGDRIRAELQRRFTHLFVDEFQDTDPLQAEILLLLAADDAAERDWRAVCPPPGKLFLVGDPKQSIYRFRRADVGIYLEVRNLLVGRGARCLELTSSFRAVPSLQRVVNAAFGARMREDAAVLQAAHVPLSPHRAENDGQPSVVVLPVPRPFGVRGGVTAGAVESSLPDAIAAYVDWLVRESGWSVTERERPGERVPLAARHVCLLFRRFLGYAGDVAHGYVEALEARGLPHLLVGGGSFHRREEVETMRTALAAIEWPDDELSVFATLRGSLFAFGDADLFEYRHRHGRFHPFRLPQGEAVEEGGTGAEIAAALDFLAGLHRRRNRRTVAETITLLLERTRAHAGFAMRPSGEQVLANVLHVAELARAYEAAGGISFRGFVQQLLADADGGRAAEAPILEEGSDGVRLMSVHRAKGLEFPVVVLADVSAHLGRPTAARHLDPVRGLCAVRLAGWAPVELLEQNDAEVARDEAEAVRVAYVAATRARDLLVVPAPAAAWDRRCWTEPLHGALFPPRRGEGWAPPSATEVEGCPPFGASPVVAPLPAAAFGAPLVRPGRYDFDEGHAVVWWDPNLLRLDVRPLFGIRQRELLSKETPDEVVDAGRRTHDEWRAERDAALAAGERPSMVVSTATARAATAAPGAGDPIEVQIVELPRARDRPSGARFGDLVHGILAQVALDAGDGDVAAAAELIGRLRGASAAEVAAAVGAACAALGHDLLRRARAAAVCRRETPVTLREADGTLVDGVVDLAFLEDGAWTVVDFKTDRELGRDLDVYARQVDLYCRAIAAATGQPAAGVLLRV